MGIYEELQARGLIAQVTDEEESGSLLIMERLFFISALTLRRTAFM